jgi:hypothetical protein
MGGSQTMNKKAFLVAYDYGMGAVWMYFLARETTEIVAKYPELQVVEPVPKWMSSAELQEIAQKMTFDIDLPPTGWLLSLIAERGSGHSTR